MEQCSGRITIDGWRDGRCSREGKVERNGKWFCTQHDPERIEKKRLEQRAKWKAVWDADKAKHEWEAAAFAACEGLTTGELAKLTPAMLRAALS